jgi:DNA topoisomerase-2
LFVSSRSWKESTDNDAKGWTIKYYKGLGTSTSQEAKEYFGNLGIHEVHFSELSSDKTSSQAVVAYDSDAMDFEDPAPDKVISGSDLIEMAFSKGRVEDRKIWLNNLEKDTYLNYSEAQEDGVKYSDFINKELILFSQADNQRSIPHLMDGFKPSQRKVLFACIKKKLTHAKPEMKVAQLAGYIGEHSAYHHGEASLHGTIVNMAQSFCGSNNVNLLTPSGQFGTRRMGGKDSASPRYIFTKLEKVARTIFHPDDDAILTYLNDDGMSIEPEYYMPVIPLVLVNGSEGIGTGWSSNVPNFCPRAIIANLRHLIAGKELEKMVPHFYGFTGDIVAETGKREGSYVVQGRIERKDDTTLFISELPIKRWTQDYKVFLESMATNDGKTDPDIKDFQENHTDTTISFTITAAKEKIDAFEKEKNGLCGKFKLTGSLSTSNMTLFDKKGRITRYEKPEDILFAFYELRLDYYSRRKELLLKNLKWDQKMLSNKARFVEEVCSGDLVVSNRKRTDILADLQERGYDLLQKEDTNKTDEDSDEETDDTETDAELAKGYEYLLGMKIWSLTFEKAEELRAKFAEKTQEVAELEETSPSQIWQNDLDAIEVALDERDAEMEAAAKEEVKAQKKNTKQQAKKASKAAAKRGQKKKKGEWDSDDESSSSEDEVGKDESDDDIEPKKKAPVKSKSAPKQRKVVMKDENASASVPSSAKPVAKPKVDSRMAPLPAKLAGNHKVTAKKVSSPMKEDSSSDEEGFGLSLAERLGKKKPLTSLSSKKSSSMQEESNASDDSFTSFDASEFKPASLTPAAKKAATKKVAAKRPRGTTEDKKSISTTVSAAARKPAKKNKIVGDFDFEDSDVEVVAAPVHARTRPGRARAKVSYNLLSDEDEGEDSDSDF